MFTAHMKQVSVPKMLSSIVGGGVKLTFLGILGTKIRRNKCFYLVE